MTAPTWELDVSEPPELATVVAAGERPAEPSVCVVIDAATRAVIHSSRSAAPSRRQVDDVFASTRTGGTPS